MEEIYSEAISEIDWDMFDFENDMEPISRARSNTWPVPQPENYLEANVLTDNCSKVGSTEYMATGTSGKAIDGPSRKKKTPRQNPWGDVSYAELITQAINSTEHRRLTLSQIYDWMVQNVPFFRDKSESKSSAGWKNSVRHNLSLHSRFMRIPNETHGRSSWWTINPDAPSGKTTRRRAASMEAGKLEKKRALANKRADSLRKKLLKNESTTASSDDIGGNAPSTLVNKHLQEHFRARASSCASSISNFTMIPQIPEEQVWPACAYQEPVCQPPMQPVSQPPMQPVSQPPMQPLSQPPMQPASQPPMQATSKVYIRQEYLQPADEQIFIGEQSFVGEQISSAPQNFAELTAVCLTHPVGGCNCGNLVAMSNQVPSAGDGSEQLDLKSLRTNVLRNLLQNVITRTVEIIDPALVQRKEETDVNCNTYASVGHQVDQVTDNQALPRSNSMLDDINEIIKKDQVVDIERVNDSLSATLFISNNNNLIQQQ